MAQAPATHFATARGSAHPLHPAAPQPYMGPMSTHPPEHGFMPTGHAVHTPVVPPPSPPSEVASLASIPESTPVSRTSKPEVSATVSAELPSAELPSELASAGLASGVPSVTPVSKTSAS